MLKWFYLVHLNYDALDVIPPLVEDMELNLLCLHKVVESLGGYFSVTMGDKWGIIAQLQGLDTKDDEAVRNCYKRFIDLVVIYHETAQVPWGEKPGQMGETSNVVAAKDPSGQKDSTVKDGTQGEDTSKFGIRLEDEDDYQQGSSQDSNDFEVIT